MPDFTVTDEIESKISAQFGVPKEEVERLNNFYKTIVNDMKRQYLAHIIRTMEERLRKIPGNEMFQIICSPVDGNSKNFGIARADYYKGRYFAIFYHPDTDEKQLRIMLAHELGHLFLVELYNSCLNLDFDENTMIEPRSTILGILAILDKNDFYHNKTSPFKHPSPDAVLDDFVLLKNRDNNRFNVS
jgi:Zn-dependent peptidase ImmA (M78 family)